MTMTIHVDIVSAEAEIYSGLAEMVYAPAEMGEVGIAPRHTPLLTRLRPGTVRVEIQPGEQEQYYVSGGILEVQPHMVTVLAEYFGDWTPASTTVCVNQLSTPGARVELDMIVAYPQK